MSESSNSFYPPRDVVLSSRTTRPRGCELGLETVTAQDQSIIYFFMIMYLKELPRVWSSCSISKDAAVSLPPGS